MERPGSPFSMNCRDVRLDAPDGQEHASLRVDLVLHVPGAVRTLRLLRSRAVEDSVIIKRTSNRRRGRHDPPHRERPGGQGRIAAPVFRRAVSSARGGECPPSNYGLAKDYGATAMTTRIILQIECGASRTSRDLRVDGPTSSLGRTISPARSAIPATFASALLKLIEMPSPYIAVASRCNVVIPAPLKACRRGYRSSSPQGCGRLRESASNYVKPRE